MGRKPAATSGRTRTSESGGNATLARSRNSLHAPAMLKIAYLVLAFSGAGLLAACVQMRADDPPIVVNVKSDGEQCRVTVLRNPYSQPQSFLRVTQAQLLQVGRETKSRRAIVVVGGNTPYKCMGAAIITLQQAGLLVDLAPWDDR